MCNLGKISLEFYLIHYLIINYGVIAAKRSGLNPGIGVIPLTVLFFVLSLCGARLLHSFSEWLLAALGKKKTK